MSDANSYLVSLLNDLSEFLEPYVDVVDGSYGEYAPNKAMSLQQDIEDAIYRLKHSDGPVVIPEGWALVPWKPTQRMLEAGDSLCSRVGNGPLRRVVYPAGVGPEDVYECMVAAAPSCGATEDQGSK